jgi:hypothetical protein
LTQSFNASIKYEQFDSEILLKIRIDNSGETSQNFTARLSLDSRDFSQRQITGQVTEELVVDSMSILDFNMATLEYSVLARSKVKLDLFQNDKLVAVDSLDLTFPNSFSGNGGTRDVEIDLGGLKTDRTRTPVGRNFFEQFEKLWVSPTGMSDYTIQFEELPFRFRTTRLKVYLDGDLVVENFLRDNDEFITQLLSYTIAIINSKLAERTKRDDEIGGDWNGI